MLGGGTAGPRRAARLLDEDVGEGAAEDRDVVAAPVAVHGQRPVGLDDLEPPRRFTRWHLGVVVAVLLVGLVWGGWTWVRARPEAVAAPQPVQTANVPAASSGARASGAATSAGGPPGGSGPGAGPSPGASPGATASAAGLVVHVLGAVRHPGLVRLPAGARVADAIKSAGGLRDDADPDELNLAQPLDDGVQVVVGTHRHPEGEVRSSGGGTSGTGSTASSGGSGGSAAGSGASVDLNQASVEQLDTLPGVGPVTAQKIVDWREQHGRFTKADELQEVDGIGPKTYARLAPHVRV